MSNTPLNDALKPCANCGSEAQTDFIPDGSNIIECIGISCGARTGEHDSPESAIEAWNNRASAHDDLEAALEDCITRFVAAFPEADNYEPIVKARVALAKAKSLNTRANTPESGAAQPAIREVTIPDQVMRDVILALQYYASGDHLQYDQLGIADKPYIEPGHRAAAALTALSAQPSDATAQTINSDDMNDIILRRLAELNEQEASDLLNEMAEVAQPSADAKHLWQVLQNVRNAMERDDNDGGLIFYTNDVTLAEYIDSELEARKHILHPYGARALLANTAQDKP